MTINVICFDCRKTPVAITVSVGSAAAVRKMPRRCAACARHAAALVNRHYV